MAGNELRVLLERSLALWNDGDMAQADELYADPCVVDGRPLSPDDIKRFVASLFVAFPDIHFTIEEAVEEGDRIALRETVRGTHRGELRSPVGRLGPTHRAVNYTGTEWFRVVGGKIAEVRTCWDRLSMLQQLGALPAPAPSAG